jgi:hypothetical protein
MASDQLKVRLFVAVAWKAAGRNEAEKVYRQESTQLQGSLGHETEGRRGAWQIWRDITQSSKW